MVDRINAANRDRLGADYKPVTRSAVSVALVRAGESGSGRARYDDFLPWSPIRPEHNNQYPRTMLRLAARRGGGEQLSEAQLARLDAFVKSLHDKQEVITYSPAEGFIRVPARPSDSGLIRRPD